MLHPEKRFVASTKIWLTQQNFSFKYGSVEILFKLTKKYLKKNILLIQVKLKKFCKIVNNIFFSTQKRKKKFFHIN